MDTFTNLFAINVWFRKNIKILLIILAVSFGLFTGQLGLDIANGSQPPLDWTSIQFISVGACFGVIFVLGIQALIHNKRGVFYGWWLIFICSLYFLGAGLSVLVISIRRGVVGPQDIVFILIACSCLCGLLVTRKIFRTFFAK